MMKLLKLHKLIAVWGVITILFIALTGAAVQVSDLRVILADASPFDPDVLAMREDTDGPPGYAVIGPADYLAPALPAGTDMVAMVERVDRAARARLGPDRPDFVELRMGDGGRPVGIVAAGPHRMTLDGETATLLDASSIAPRFGPPSPSFRNTAKHLHRMTAFGDWALGLALASGIALAALLVTGMAVYLRQWRNRAAMGRRGAFWRAPDGWRTLHRGVAVTMALFLSVVVASGLWLQVESLCIAVFSPRHFVTLPGGQRVPGFLDPRLSTPLEQGQSEPMARAALAAYHATAPGGGIRVLRLRTYAGYRQGVVITAGAEPRQLVFDTATGKSQRLTEKGYPETGLPLGWQAHQWAKFIHRGDAFGLTGRMASLLSAISLVYLSVSGMVMYWRRPGRRGKARP
jgi:hypothetical protein